MSAETTAPFPPPRSRNPLRALDESTPLVLKLGTLVTLAGGLLWSGTQWINVQRDVDDLKAARTKIEARAEKAEDVAREMRDRLIRIEAKLDNLSR